jgi:catechol 2,3-dioxygenase-like lactoylglutathione lyase family enzyme
MKKTACLILVLTGLVLAAYAAEVGFHSKTINIGMIVSDLNKTLSFYKDVVGMVQVDRTSFDIDSGFALRSGLTDGTPFHVEVLKLGSGEEATELKVMSFGDKARKSDNQYIHSQTGVQYLTFMVDDADPVVERIKAHSIPLLGKTPTQLPDGRTFVLIKDPDGTFVEIIGSRKQN